MRLSARTSLLTAFRPTPNQESKMIMETIGKLGYWLLCH